jgi:hypothetical protein
MYIKTKNDIYSKFLNNKSSHKFKFNLKMAINF